MRNKFASRLNAEVPGVHFRAEVAEGRRALCRKILGAEGSLVIAGEGFECSRLEDLLSLVDWKHMTEHQRLH